MPAFSPLSGSRELRGRWYLLVEKDGKTVGEICRLFGISRKTYYKWYNRDHGYGSRKYESRTPHPNLKLTPRIRLAVYEAKRQYNYGPEKMRLWVRDHCGVEVSTTIIYRFFKKKRLIHKPQKRQLWYAPMKEPFVSAKPGENVQMDVKYVPGGDGLWLYQFRCTDTFTNMQYAVDALDKSAAAAIDAFRRAMRYFPFPILGVQTDNGGEFRGAFARYLAARGVMHRFIPKRSAPWNGKVERANRSVDDEYYLNSGRPWTSLAAYTRWYNCERYHLGRGMHGLTPFQKYEAYRNRNLSTVSPLNVN